MNKFWTLLYGIHQPPSCQPSTIIKFWTGNKPSNCSSSHPYIFRTVTLTRTRQDCVFSWHHKSENTLSAHKICININSEPTSTLGLNKATWETMVENSGTKKPQRISKHTPNSRNIPEPGIGTMLANKQIETKRMETKCGGVRSIR
jgi:hypothetical protein